MIAGAGAGVLAGLLHFAFVQEYILLSESYETSILVHFTDGTDVKVHSHNSAPATDGQTDNDTETARASDNHNHQHFDEMPFLGRYAGTILFTVLTYSGFGLILVTAYGLAELAGIKVRPDQGTLWGLAGFGALQLAPAMGLAPQLPGTIAADLMDRHIWWVFTALGTGLGLALLLFGRTKVMIGAGVVILTLPHIIGAPMMEGYSGVAPPEVAGAFSARLLGVGLVSWLVLGWLSTREWTKKPD